MKEKEILKIGESVYYVKKKYEDSFFKNNESLVYICIIKEMITKAVVTDILDDIISVKISNKNLDVKEIKINRNEILSKKTTISPKLLGIWD